MKFRAAGSLILIFCLLLPLLSLPVAAHELAKPMPAAHDTPAPNSRLAVMPMACCIGKMVCHCHMTRGRMVRCCGMNMAGSANGAVCSCQRTTPINPTATSAVQRGFTERTTTTQVRVVRPSSVPVAYSVFHTQAPHHRAPPLSPPPKSLFL